MIIPTHNRNAQVQTCLQALALQVYPRDHFEVIVVDDGSASPPREIVASFSKALNVTLLAEPHGGPSTARNAGAARARGEFLAFTDDDCAPNSGVAKKYRGASEQFADVLGRRPHYQCTD